MITSLSQANRVCYVMEPILACQKDLASGTPDEWVSKRNEFDITLEWLLRQEASLRRQGECDMDYEEYVRWQSKFDEIG